MARPREFDDTEVLNKLADLFTANGYQATSISMLTDASGLAKQSLYNAFGDKRALYLQAIDCATGRYAQLVQALAKAPDGYTAVETFLDALSQVCSSEEALKFNCIVSAGLIEGVDDAVIADKLRATWHTSQHVLKQAVERGQQDGSIRQDADADDLANLLMSMASGLRVTARALDDRSRLPTITAAILGLLRPIPAS